MTSEKSKNWHRRNPEKAKAAARRSYLKHREKNIARTKAWQRNNPEKYREQIKNRVPLDPAVRREQVHKRLYNMTIEQRDAMFETQGRRCAACGSTTPNAKQGWHMDHCHETNVVRGILCQNCNVGMGHAKHDPDILNLWLRYLRFSAVLY